MSQFYHTGRNFLVRIGNPSFSLFFVPPSGLGSSLRKPRLTLKGFFLTKNGQTFFKWLVEPLSSEQSLERSLEQSIEKIDRTLKLVSELKCLNRKFSEISACFRQAREKRSLSAGKRSILNDALSWLLIDA